MNASSSSALAKVSEVDHLKRWLFTENLPKPEASFSADDVKNLFNDLQQDGFMKDRRRDQVTTFFKQDYCHFDIIYSS